MLSWCCGIDAGGVGCIRRGLGALVILLLAMGVTNTRGASPKSELRQKPVQVTEGGCRHVRFAQVHADAGRGVDHPGRHNDDDAGLHLYMDDLTAHPMLAVLTPHATSVQRVPAVEDFDFLPDMGRMTP